ncbi:hypothetical protein NLG97_g1282 [Lecanicillium saksenae]|uniref:Uncharacterized protein n=1 Tax=Lecanicillium saksenae TaxID=468837 RepID=A0ACC1R4U2_9HYPO|nr:hypothetical protein NLG97_g1282 [Lecanicillium saksenae]
MPLRETDLDFAIELFEKVKAAVNAKYEVFKYALPLPLLLVDPDVYVERPLPCHEPVEETTTISAHLLARIHAFYEQIAAACNGIEDLPARLGIKLEIQPQNFDPKPPHYYHRRHHSRRLQLHDPKKLLDLPFITCPNLIHPAEKDPVSVGLCKLGTQLSLFDMWRFRLEFHSLHLDGRWYFVGPGGEDPHDSEQGGYKILDIEYYPPETDIDEDMDLHAECDDELGDKYDYHIDMFRIRPCRERIKPLLTAFIKSLTYDNMPSLEDAEVFMYLWWDPSNDREVEGYNLPMVRKGHRWGIKFITGRGSKNEKDGTTATTAPTPPVVQWQVGDWRPSEEVMSLFKRLGQQVWLDLEWDGYRSTAGFDVLGNSESSRI